MATEETPLLLPPHETTTTTTTNGLLLLSPPPPPSGGGTDEVGGEEEEEEEKEETAAIINTKTPKTTNKKRSSSLSLVSKVNDEYIISLIRRTRTSTTVGENDTTSGNNNDDGSLLADDDDNMNNNSDVDENDGTGTRTGSDGGSDEGTTFGQTVIHLVKGYIGCGILSLPWAISQLGIPVGLLAIVFMSLWSSYNCWTVVKIKQYLERTQTLHNTNNTTDDDSDSDDDDDHSEISRISRRTSDVSMASSNITYPDVGEWAHGIEFQKYISICICAQQLAICTVFISFVSENLSASLKFFDVPTHLGFLHLNHVSVGAMIMPIILGLSCGLPTVKSMAPFMVCAFVLMISGFASLGYIGYLKWDDRPTSLTIDDGGDSNELGLPTFHFDKNAPMALCGILYSFEGICIVLPVENSMIKYDNNTDNNTTNNNNNNHQRQRQQRKYYHSFQMAFIISMIIITLLLCLMAGMGVYVFGTVTNGSITAFLLEEYKDSNEIQFWVMFSNVLVTISIIFSYPLMLYPAIECIAPTYHEWTVNIKRKYNHFWTSIRLAQERNQNRNQSHHHRNNRNRNNDDDSSSSTNSRLDDESSGFNTFNTCKTSEDDDGTNNEPGKNNDDDGDIDDNDGIGSEDQNLEGFERMVGIPEHEVASVISLKSLLVPESAYQHEYDTNNNDEIKSTSAVAAVNDDNETADTGEATDGGGLDGSATLSHFSSVTYQRQSLVDGEDDDDDDDDDDDGNNNDKMRSQLERRRSLSAAFTWQVPGDSPYFRAVIVMGTYCIAMLVPNVQSLVAVVGAVTGSSTALLIPPILELAYIRHLETLEEKRVRTHRTPPLESEWEGGPSKALKRTLLESSYSQQSQSSSSSQPQTMHTNIYQPLHRNHPNNNSNSNTNTRSKREQRNNNTNRTHRRRKKKKYLFEKIVSWCLLILGSIFALIGSYFSIRDIIQSYE